jgi:hypothetical protein
LREETGISRDILVDDLAGTVHRAYGLMPNMTWVIDRGGRVVYKANWTSAANVEAFLARFLAARGQRPAGTAAVMYETEQIEYRYTYPALFNEHLLRNGPPAAKEFGKARGTVGGPILVWVTVTAAAYLAAGIIVFRVLERVTRARGTLGAY